MVKQTEQKNEAIVDIMIRKMFEDLCHFDENAAAWYETSNMHCFLDDLGSNQVYLAIGQDHKITVHFS